VCVCTCVFQQIIIYNGTTDSARLGTLDASNTPLATPRAFSAEGGQVLTVGYTVGGRPLSFEMSFSMVVLSVPTPEATPEIGAAP